MTKHQLASMLFSVSPSSPVTVKGVTGYLRSVSREDGSGSSFIVSLFTQDGKSVSVHVRTVD